MKSLTFLLAILFSVAVQAKQPTSIIYVIGDGMGPSYTSAYRYFVNEHAAQYMETTIFDELFVGMARTYPNDKVTITDSAASATALATGVKSFNGAIGVDVNNQPVTTLLEAAKAQNYRTALVVTSTINHATPASFVAHVGSRQSYDEIANQYFDERINGKLKVDLMLGGGQQFFARKDRDITKEFVAEGYHYITDLAKLDTIKKLPAIGLFAQDGMPSELDSEEPLKLTTMTTKALALLQDKPFFLLIEASQIDWCGHANDIACAMGEMHDMAETLKLVKRYIDKHPNTIMVATADHSTGGLSVGAAGQYDWGVAVIKRIKATAPKIADHLIAAKPEAWQAEWERLSGIELSQSEQAAMEKLLKSAQSLPQDEDAKISRKAAKNAVVAQVLDVINDRTNTGWTSNGHTGEDVQVFSYGKNHKIFSGNLDNTDLAKKLFSYLPTKKK